MHGRRFCFQTRYGYIIRHHPSLLSLHPHILKPFKHTTASHISSYESSIIFDSIPSTVLRMTYNNLDTNSSAPGLCSSCRENRLGLMYDAQRTEEAIRNLKSRYEQSADSPQNLERPPLQVALVFRIIVWQEAFSADSEDELCREVTAWLDEYIACLQSGDEYIERCGTCGCYLY